MMISARVSGDPPVARVRPTGPRCAHCPVDPALRCGGIEARRLCDLINPEHPAYDPGYRESIRQQARDLSGYPPLATQAANLARAFWHWAMGGFEMASDEEQARRLAICQECVWFDPGPVRCRHMGCGCFLKAKIQLATEHCPLPEPKW